MLEKTQNKVGKIDIYLGFLFIIKCFITINKFKNTYLFLIFNLAILLVFIRYTLLLCK